MKIESRDLEILSKEPGEAFFEPSRENILPSMPVVAYLRKAMNSRNRKKALNRLASDLLASVLRLCKDMRGEEA